MTLLERVGENQEEFIGLRRRIHENAEVSFEEFETTKLVREYLDQLGIENHPNGAATGAVGILKGKKPGPVIALRADMDALKLTEQSGLPFASKNPGACHACGHDIHTAVLLGTAKILKSYEDDLCGTVKFLFQPAEEGLGGSKVMIENGALENPKVDYILACHTWPEMPAGSIGVRKGAMLGASDTFKITVMGKGGHAAHPHKGIDPVVIAAHIITELQTIVSRRIAPVDAAVITVGHLTAGTVSNIIPNEKTDRINDEALALCNHRSNLEKGDVLFSGTGTIGETAIVKETPTNWNIKEGVYTIKPNPQILSSRYLRYLLESSPIKKVYMTKAVGGTVKSVPMKELRKIKIPVPPLAEQERIVAILDKFDALVNDISRGLPAEIEARKKQYAHYRDRLLDFREKRA